MRYLFYYYNHEGMLEFNYRDDYGRHIHMRYLYYSFRSALQKFRQDYNLQHKKIVIHSLY